MAIGVLSIALQAPVSKDLNAGSLPQHSSYFRFSINDPDIFLIASRKLLDCYTYSVYDILKGKMTAKEIEKILKADSWYFVTSKGSHNQYKHTGNGAVLEVLFNYGFIGLCCAELIAFWSLSVLEIATQTAPKSCTFQDTTPNSFRASSPNLFFDVKV